ncbi:MAG: DUF1080 domain-containing protein, partial [Planctomycetes bacterium]|nr:DUF1080 domain-containing protein [Planctomycetota bacterium]
MQKSLFSVLFLLTLSALWADSVSTEQLKYIKKYKKQANVPVPEEMLINKEAEPKLEEGFTSLYNGQNLEGWKAKGGHCTFEAKGDAIIGTCIPKSPSTYLSTLKDDYTDFIFSAELKWEVDGNTGIMFRAQSKEGKKYETVFGPQAEMEGLENGRGWSGGIYGQACGGWSYPLWLESHKEARKALKKGDWNRVTIKAQGKT